MSDDPWEEVVPEEVPEEAVSKEAPVKPLESPQSFIDKLMAFGGDSIESIIMNLLDGSRDVTLKTELNNPQVMAQARVFVMMCRKGGATIAADYLEEYLNQFEKAMISYKRQRSAEVIQALSSMGIAAQERSAKEKLFGSRGEVK